MGHHPMYFVQYAAALARLGCRVVPFCVQPADFLQRLALVGLGEEERERVEEPVGIRGPAASAFRPARWRGHYDALRFFGGLGGQLRAWEQRKGSKLDLVFFSCIYDRQFEHFRLAERRFGFPWAGLYLHARSFRMPGSPIPYVGGLPCPERIFTSPWMRAAGVLDEGVVAPMERLSGGKPVVVFPDMTQTQLPEEGGDGWGLVNKLELLARGRPMVSLVGHLQWTKGLADFSALMARPEMRDVFFVLGGEVYWGQVETKERTKMERIWEQSPNVLAHLQALPESTMNSVISRSDAVFGAYRSFPNSSNVLTKAAYFERPILVSDGYLMAERVRKYGLGEVVPEGDGEALVRAVRRMVAPGYREELGRRARWSDYRFDHSADRLPECFAGVISARGRS